MTIGHRIRIALTITLGLAAFSAALASGQGRRPIIPPLDSTPPPMPAAQAFGHLFYMVATVERDADTADRRGDMRRARGLRKHLQDRIGLKDNEAATLKFHARAVAAAVEAPDRKARDIIAEVRRQTPEGKLRGDQKPPSIPRKLVELQAERDQAITARVALLERSLGTEAFRKLEKFARAEHAKALAPARTASKPHFIQR